jgi:uncharacterized membrane protein
MPDIKKWTLAKTLPWILVIGGLIGFFASFDLAVEKMMILKDPSFQPSCNISPILSCGSVMVTDQSEAFGFANPFMGVAGFAVVTTIGMALLAGAQFKRWFWLGLQTGVIFGISFISWLFFQSVYRIGALCPYCMVVWSVMLPIFWYTTLYNIRENHIRLPKSWDKFKAFIFRHHADILIVWYLLIIFAILKRFWYYWSSLI